MAEAQRQRDIEAAKRDIGPTRVFVSYSHADEEHRRALETHLAPLSHEGLIRLWHDRKIAPGKEWAGEIDHHLESASIVLLLVSADFIASEYCYQREMHRALQRHAAGQARVIPVIVRPADWEHSPLGSLQALPEGAKPVTNWPDTDTAWLSVARGVRQAVEAQLRPALEVTEAPPSSKMGAPCVPIVEPSPWRILHLSDLHFRAGENPTTRLQPLVDDLRDCKDGFGFDTLDYLVISGDLTDRARPEEFERVHQFLSALVERFKLSSERCLIVPGNHDLSWDVPAYQWSPKRQVDPAKLRAGTFVEQGEGYLLRDDAVYPQRFEAFAKFHHAFTQRPYPLAPEQQAQALLFEDSGLQFLGMSSAWEVDEWFPDRASINPHALAHTPRQRGQPARTRTARKSPRARRIDTAHGRLPPPAHWQRQDPGRCLPRCAP